MSQPKQDEPTVTGPGGPPDQPAAHVNVKDDVTPPGHAGEPRRGALRTIVALGTLAYAGALVVPAARFAASTGASEGPKKARWVRVGRLVDLPETGEPRRVQIIDDDRDAFTVTKNQMLGSVWVIREGATVRAMSATCPHLGCSIDLNSDKKSFGCPCHASRFALTGASEAGPSPRAMDPLTVRIVDGWIEIDFRRFRQGTSDREEA
jgi:cytochrome b6-f complex iron-sulfur subunit/menaquinol-cytochrome c reductase iron-sulfur subunit